jgi:hypothetical protein
MTGKNMYILKTHKFMQKIIYKFILSLYLYLFFDKTFFIYSFYPETLDKSKYTFFFIQSLNKSVFLKNVCEYITAGRYWIGKECDIFQY